MNHKRWSIWLTAAIAAASVFGACGAPAPTSSQSRSPAPAVAEPAATAASTPSAMASAPDALAGLVLSPEVVASNTTPHPVNAIEAGWDICAIREDGTLACWPGPNEDSPDGTYVALDSGMGSACAIRTEGGLECWGFIGDDPPRGDFVSVSVSQSEACAVRRDGSLACWQAPEEEEDGEPSIVARPPTGTFAAVSMGDYYHCALRTNGQLACWAAIVEDLPRIPADAYQAIDVPCAIRVGGQLDCFESFEASLSKPPTEGSFMAVSATTNPGQGCAVRVDGTLACWGSGGMDEAGNDLPMRIPPGQFVDVTVGENLACATRDDGTAVCWGESDEQARPAPSGRFDAPLWHDERDIPIGWGATPAFGRIVSYDIDISIGHEGQSAETGWARWRTGTTSVSEIFRGDPGQTYCWRVQAHDADGLTSTWAGACTTLPHDDGVFDRSAGWSTVDDSGYYGGGASKATRQGAQLTLDVATYGLGILATTCRSCGSIDVYVGDERYETISLHSSRTRHRQLVFWSNHGDEGFGSFDSNDERHPVRVTIEVVSKGKPVIIEGALLGPGPE